MSENISVDSRELELAATHLYSIEEKLNLYHLLAKK